MDEGNVVEPLEDKIMDVYVVIEPITGLNTVNFFFKIMIRFKSRFLILAVFFHMTSKRSWLENYKDMNGGEMIMGNNAACRVLWIDSVN